MSGLASQKEGRIFRGAHPADFGGATADEHLRVKVGGESGRRAPHGDGGKPASIAVRSTPPT
jgi:hypothetical protein